jgi:dipeptidase E
MRLLLMSSAGNPPYECWGEEMRSFLGDPKKIGLITAANLFDEDLYFKGMATSLTQSKVGVGGEFVHIRPDLNWREALEGVQALMVPGGNTYALLMQLRRSGLLGVLREKILNGLPYIGSSAGSVVMGPNILTTNDWNVVGLTEFEAFGLVPFNINPHHFEGAISGAPNSESRDLRIGEFHKIWSNAVVGLEETAAIQVQNGKYSIVGQGRARIFERNQEAYWAVAGHDLFN